MHYKQLSRSAEQQSDAYRGFRCKVKYVTFVCARPRAPVSDTANVPGPQCADRHFAESGRPRTHLVEHFCFVLACWRRQDFSKARHGCDRSRGERTNCGQDSEIFSGRFQIGNAFQAGKVRDCAIESSESLEMRLGISVCAWWVRPSRRGSRLASLPY